MDLAAPLTARRSEDDGGDDGEDDDDDDDLPMDLMTGRGSLMGTRRRRTGAQLAATDVDDVEYHHRQGIASSKYDQPDDTSLMVPRRRRMRMTAPSLSLSGLNLSDPHLKFPKPLGPAAAGGPLSMRDHQTLLLPRIIRSPTASQQQASDTAATTLGPWKGIPQNPFSTLPNLLAPK